MNSPTRPLKQHLAPTPAPSWDNVERRITRRRWARYAVWTLAPACALALLAMRWPRHASPLNPPPTSFVLAPGRPLPAGLTVLRDGTRLDVGANASILLSSQGPSEVVFTLLGGEVAFEVTPAARVFRVDAGLATITVVGTGFTVRREPRRVHVRVRHGAVRVEGAGVRGGASLLRGGEEIMVGADPPTPQALSIDMPSPRDAGTAPPQPSRRRSPHVAGAPRDATAPRDVPATVDVPPPAPTSDPDALWRSADLLRRAQSYEAATSLLLRLTREHPDHPRAALAAHVAGRDLLQVLHRPAHAAVAYERALNLGLAEGLREDAWLGLVESRFRARDIAGARQAARDYRARYPRGVHLSAVDTMFGGTP